MADDYTDRSGAIVLKEGEAPPFPASAHVEGLAEGDKTNIAAAAWKQAFGSILAFEQLCAEHARGEIDLIERRIHAGERAAPLNDVEEARRVQLAGMTGRTELEERDLAALQARVAAAGSATVVGGASTGA